MLKVFSPFLTAATVAAYISVYAHTVMCKYLQVMRGVHCVEECSGRGRVFAIITASLFVVLIESSFPQAAFPLTHTHTYTQNSPDWPCKAVKLYPWLDHLNWAPALSDPTAFKVS